MKIRQNFLKDEAGAGTAAAVFMSVTCLLICGAAIDGANAWRSHNELQIASDTAAMAAASLIDTPDTARSTAVQVANANLGEAAGITEDDIYFGTWDTETYSFVLASEGTPTSELDAVLVNGTRTEGRSNAVSTYVMRLYGFDKWDINVESIALSSITESEVEGASPQLASCGAATFFSEANINAGGSGTYDGDVCFHGAEGVAFGGNDYFDDEVRLSAEDLGDITASSVRPGSAAWEDLRVEQSLSASILPNLDSMFQELWDTFYGKHGELYAGNLVPGYVKDPDSGIARIVQVNGWWSIQPGDVEPYTIYVVDGGAQFSGDVDAQNVAFIVNGYFGTGGGWNLHFYDTYIFGTQIGLAGNVEWGTESSVCDEERYSVHLFAKNSLNLGGWSNPTPINGLIAVAPRIEPGGSMTGTGLYMETEETFVPGGDWNITGCSNGNAPVADFVDLTEVKSTSATETVTVRRSVLRR